MVYELFEKLLDWEWFEVEEYRKSTERLKWN